MLAPGTDVPRLLIAGASMSVIERFRQAWTETTPGGDLASAESVRALLATSAQLRPEFVVLPYPWVRDAGLDLISRLSCGGRTRVLVLGGEFENLALLRALAAGLDGSVGETPSVDTIVRLIRALRSGEAWISRRRVVEMLRALPTAEEPERSGTWRRLPSLTEREHAVLQEVLAGLPNKEIARRLDIAEHTVKVHLQNLYAKLGVHRRVELITAFAAQWQLQRG